MRLVVDGEAGSLRVEFETAPVVRRDTRAGGVEALFDAAGRLVGLEVDGVGTAALREVTVAWSGSPDTMPSRTAEAQTAAVTRPPPPTPYTGPLTWDAEAEAAMERVPFFSRGRHRLAAIALARRRGLDRVSVEVVDAASP